MIKLHEINEWPAKSKKEALIFASNYTGFFASDFKCEVIKEPKKIGLFKKEDGIYHCWYEYPGMNADKEFRIADAFLYVDTTQKKILVIRSGYRAYEIDYSDLTDYEMVIASNHRTYTLSNKNKALKGALLFGTVGAIIGAADSETVSETVEEVEMIIRLKFASKESFEILTCNNRWETDEKEWRDILDQGKVIDEFFRELLEE